MAHDPGAYALGQLIGGTATDLLQVHESRRVQGIINNLQAQVNQLVAQRNQLIEQNNLLTDERDQALERCRFAIDDMILWKHRLLDASQRGWFELARFQNLEKLIQDLIRHRAQRAVFKAEMSKLFPKHPLVWNDALRKSISEAAVREWVEHSRNGETDDSFRPDGRSPDSKIWERVDSAALSYYEYIIKTLERRWAEECAAQSANARAAKDTKPPKSGA